MLFLRSTARELARASVPSAAFLLPLPALPLALPILVCLTNQVNPRPEVARWPRDEGENPLMGGVAGGRPATQDGLQPECSIRIIASIHHPPSVPRSTRRLRLAAALPLRRGKQKAGTVTIPATIRLVWYLGSRGLSPVLLPKIEDQGS